MQSSSASMNIDRRDFQRLARNVAGKIILREDADYEAARRVWNGMIDKRPLGIVRCINPDDVLATIPRGRDRKSTRLNSSHQIISYAVFCLKTKKIRSRN